MQWLSSYHLVEQGADVHAHHNPFTGLLAGFSQKNNVRLLLHVPRSSLAVHAVYAAYLHHIPYIPLDVQLPPARCLPLFETVDPLLALVQKNTPLHQRLVSSPHRVLWENQTATLFHLQQEAAPHPKALAAVLFTSGSTGLPKGVMIPRTAIEAFTDWMTATYNISNRTRILAISPLHFDLSVFELFSVFSKGAVLCFAATTGLVNPRLLAAAMHEYKTDTLYATPTWYRLLLDHGKMQQYDFDFVKTVLVAGEAFPVQLANDLSQVFPRAQLANLYGPTETNVCTFYNLPPQGQPIAARQGVVSIGQACPYAQLRTNHDVLEVSGSTLMLGYWPQGDFSGFYATGDLVREQNGLYFFEGRNDRLVKRNGYRISLDEVEACLAPLTRHVAVTCTQKMVAYYAGQAGADALRSHCLQHLPAWMVPDVFRPVENWPLTASGKTDYRKLATYDRP